MARLLFAASLIVAVMLAGLMPAAAQSKAQKAAEEALRAGVSAQKARKHNAAVGQFTKAINSGGLARKQLTYALYRRAISHRAAKRPAQAISDLNSALFFKGDLSTGDRAAAVKERSRAYRDAGLKPTTLATGVAQSGGNGAAVAASSKPAEGRIQPRQSLSTLPPTAPILGGPEPKGVRQAQQRAASARASSPAAPTSGFRTRISKPSAESAATQQRNRQTASANWNTGTTSTTAAKRAIAPKTSGWSQTKVVPQARQQQTGGTTTPSSPTNSVAGFFSSIFGSGPSSAGSANKVGKPVVTGATPAVRPSTVAAQRASAPSPSASNVAAGTVTYDIAVAAVRSQAGARALAKRLNSKYAGSASWEGKQARVDTLPATALRGRLYSVKLGVYTSLGALASQCEKLIADGMECQVIRRN